jgi:Molybdopterin-binding domain of aldehyde dehydrogenase
VVAVVGSETRLGRIAGRARFLPKFLLESRRWLKAATGVQFCEVRVDADTGETRVSRWVGVCDIGRVINTASLTTGQLVVITKAYRLAHAVPQSTGTHLLLDDRVEIGQRRRLTA